MFDFLLFTEKILLMSFNIKLLKENAYTQVSNNDTNPQCSGDQ